MGFAGFVGAVFVSSTDLEEEPRLALNLMLTGRFDGPARERADAARMLFAFATHEHVSVRVPGWCLMRDSHPRRRGPGHGAGGPARTDQGRVGRRGGYRGAAGAHFELPEQWPGDYDLAAIGTAARVLKTREGTATFEAIEGTVEAHGIARLADRLSEARVTRPVRYTIFGHEVRSGIGEYDVPPMTAVEVAPLGTTPDAPARVRLRPAGDDQTRFRLVD